MNGRSYPDTVGVPVDRRSSRPSSPPRQNRIRPRTLSTADTDTIKPSFAADANPNTRLSGSQRTMEQ